jgi:chromosome segregation ATPase
LTKVSPSRMGPPRFGNRPHNIDTSVKTYQLTPEQLERYKNGENLDDILKEAKEVERQKPKVIAYTKYEEVMAERDGLKKQLAEKEEEYELLKQEVEHYRELFEAAMANKEQLHKENLILENQIQRLKEVNDELTAKNERYFADLMRLEQEVKGLRLYALQKLHIDVYGA